MTTTDSFYTVFKNQGIKSPSVLEREVIGTQIEPKASDGSHIYCFPFTMVNLHDIIHDTP